VQSASLVHGLPDSTEGGVSWASATERPPSPGWTVRPVRLPHAVAPEDAAIKTA